MNVYDSSRLVALLETEGWKETDDLQSASMYILNTCSIREKASEKVFSFLGRLQKEKERAKKRLKTPIFIGVVGCVAKDQSDNIFKRAPYVDFVLDSQSYHKIFDFLKGPTEKFIKTNLPSLEKFDVLPKIKKTPASAQITIQEGCDHNCTYCVVPFTRGREISRPFTDIINEINHVVSLGAKEIVLLGQNVNGYQFKADNKIYRIYDIIKNIAKNPKVSRVRYVSAHPLEMTDDLISLYDGSIKCMLPHLHLPLQAGSNRTLKRMNRGYTKEDYFKIVEKLKIVSPDIKFSTDLIVGFPGESEEEFLETLEMVKQINFITSFSFIYSARDHTPALKLADDIDYSTKLDRLNRLQSALTKIQTNFNLGQKNTKITVFIEDDAIDKNFMLGRSIYMQTVLISKTDSLVDTIIIGKIYIVEITRSTPNNLYGKII